ncbi:MAG: hypothetical protein AAFN66_05365 [Pseudomonadota bacterium]
MGDKRKAGLQIKVVWRDDKWEAVATRRGQVVETRHGNTMLDALDELRNRLNRYQDIFEA